MFIANKMSNDDYMKIPNIYNENQVTSWYNKIAGNPIFKMFNMPDQMVKEMFAVGLNTATAWKNGELMPYLKNNRDHLTKFVARAVQLWEDNGIPDFSYDEIKNIFKTGNQYYAQTIPRWSNLVRFGSDFAVPTAVLTPEEKRLMNLSFARRYNTPYVIRNQK